MYLSINSQGNVYEALQSGCILIFKVTSREDETMARKELGLREMP